MGSFGTGIFFTVFNRIQKKQNSRRHDTDERLSSRVVGRRFKAQAMLCKLCLRENSVTIGSLIIILMCALTTLSVGLDRVTRLPPHNIIALTTLLLANKLLRKIRKKRSASKLMYQIKHLRRYYSSKKLYYNETESPKLSPIPKTSLFKYYRSSLLRLITTVYTFRCCVVPIV